MRKLALVVALALGLTGCAPLPFTPGGVRSPDCRPHRSPAGSSGPFKQAPTDTIPRVRSGLECAPS